jgi:chaperonin GroEL
MYLHKQIEQKEFIESITSHKLIYQISSILQNFVGSTLGPNGRTSLIYTSAKYPKITKDGVTVAKSLSFDTDIKNAIADIIKAVSIKVVNTVGDGTTTAMIIATELYKQFYEYSQHNNIKMFEIMNDFENIENELIDNVMEMSIPVKNENDLKKIALISANGDNEISNLVVESLQASGLNGGILIKKDLSINKSYLESSIGYQLSSGYATPYFLKPSEENMRINIENAMVVVFNDFLNDYDKILPLLQNAKTMNKSLLIIANDFDKYVLQVLTENRYNNALNVVAIKLPGIGEMRTNIMNDLCFTLGIQPSKTNTTHNISNVSKIQISENQTIISGILEGASENEIQVYIDNLLGKLEGNNLSDFQESQIRERVARLSGDIITIYIGGNSEIEVLEKKDRVEDALYSVKSALKGGYLYGAGYGFFKLYEYINKKYDVKNRHGLNIISESFLAPLKYLYENNDIMFNGEIKNLAIEKYKSNMIYNVKTDLFESIENTSIIDPTNVIIRIIESAFSVVKALIGTGAIIDEN